MGRTVLTKTIGHEVARMCREANFFLPRDVVAAMQVAEAGAQGRERRALEVALDNAQAAGEGIFPLCQDTGMIVVLLEVGQEVIWQGDFLEDEINRAVGRVYRENCFRASVVSNPLIRENTGDNTPAVIHYQLVPGDKVKISIIPKGFGSENKTLLKMLNPSQGAQGVKDFVIEAVCRGGADPCPPVVIGVGIGGTSEKCTLLAKKALLRPIGQSHQDPYWAEMERELLAQVNTLNIGPQGTGGMCTALGVAIEAFPTHIAGLPVCVCLNCHVARHGEVII